jgi:hypothetical protein
VKIWVVEQQYMDNFDEAWEVDSVWNTQRGAQARAEKIGKNWTDVQYSERLRVTPWPVEE